ncbi:hypothetical protein M413DRAFT_443638 [Hebeloma cylindrosporum]|uniref:Uncharacterized protein n=1 Tax=Hebeloma cylindrosporum TaxID=76867 RepID=A0A0C2Y1L0_HEBCY|nr:hypothetical protein M413DRAFT_443638 [Hebeloma cylindrosporum h7]
MELALSAANYLSPIANALVYLNTTKVHPVWFPYPLAPTLHALRVSMGFQSHARRSTTPHSWGTYLTGFLIMAWGGGILSHLLLGVPPPMLYSFHPAINYISVHLLVTLVFQIFPDLLNPQVLDTILWPLDALLRTNSVTSLLGLLDTPNVHPEYQNSPLAHLIVGAIVSSGGGLSAGTLDVWSPNWTFNTPPILRAGAGWVGTLDVWGGALVALIYSSTTGHKAFTSLHTYTTLLLSSHTFSLTRKPHPDSDFPPLSALAAKSLAGAVLGLLFAARVIKLHWLPAEKVAVTPRSAATPMKKGKKKIQ